MEYTSVFIPTFVPSDSSSMPLGSPKYIPPVNSLSIIISKPETISFFKLDASANASNTIAGLKFANNPNSFLNFSNPRSGFSEKGKLS